MLCTRSDSTPTSLCISGSSSESTRKEYHNLNLFQASPPSSSNLDTIHVEVTHALEIEGSSNKHALARFHKTDSVLREVGWMCGVGNRMWVTPSGSRLLYLSLTSQLDPNSRPEPLTHAVCAPLRHHCSCWVHGINIIPIHHKPDVFDPFGFLRLRDNVT